jgi:hypothetical protein
MVELNEVLKQLKKIDFDIKGWGKSEIKELPHILLPGEIIYEAVNGLYDGGFALLVATDIRLLLIDKKPLNYLTVEDMRFDMISQMDYNHRLMGAEISISSGSKRLRFRSYNQQRLRDLIGHVQSCMADTKRKATDHQEGQILHLENINKQLQSYLIAQSNYQSKVQSGVEDENAVTEPPTPSDELKDYLFAQSLLAQHKAVHKDDHTETVAPKATESNATVESEDSPVVPAPLMPVDTKQEEVKPVPASDSRLENELYKEAVREVYGINFSNQSPNSATSAQNLDGVDTTSQSTGKKISLPKVGFDVNPMHIAYSKLPVALRSRRFNKTHSDKSTEIAQSTNSMSALKSVHTGRA